jgi:membrane-associated phospholipid phosphatase
MNHHDIINQVGSNSPFIISVIVLYLLRNNTPYLWAFILGSLLNHWLNLLLKISIQDPRPRIINDPNYLGAQQYGMPSGHAQIAFFAITFYYLVKKHNTNTFLFSFLALSGITLSCITLYQRYTYKYHTLEQLLVGAIMGSAFAQFIVNGTKQYLIDQ